MIRHTGASQRHVLQAPVKCAYITEISSSNYGYGDGNMSNRLEADLRGRVCSRSAQTLQRPHSILHDDV